MVKKHAVSEGFEDTGIWVSHYRITIADLGAVDRESEALIGIWLICYPIDCIKDPKFIPC